MLTAIVEFRVGMGRVRALHGLHAGLSIKLTAAVDLSDLLRAELVAAVSVFDTFIHHLTRLGMLECMRGERPRSGAFDKFKVPFATAENLTMATFDQEIREQHSLRTFQHPDRVADAVRLISGVKLWEAVGRLLQEDPKVITDRLGLVVDRRNKIAHEADIDPTYPGQRWPIDTRLVEDALATLEGIAEQVFVAVTLV